MNKSRTKELRKSALKSFPIFQAQVQKMKPSLGKKKLEAVTFKNYFRRIKKNYSSKV